MVVKAQKERGRVSTITQRTKSKTYVRSERKRSILWEKNSWIKEKSWGRPLKPEKSTSISEIKGTKTTRRKIQ